MNTDIQNLNPKDAKNKRSLQEVFFELTKYQHSNRVWELLFDLCCQVVYPRQLKSRQKKRKNMLLYDKNIVFAQGPHLKDISGSFTRGQISEDFQNPDDSADFTESVYTAQI